MKKILNDAYTIAVYLAQKLNYSKNTGFYNDSKHSKTCLQYSIETCMVSFLRLMILKFQIYQWKQVLPWVPETSVNLSILAVIPTSEAPDMTDTSGTNKHS